MKTLKSLALAAAGLLGAGGVLAATEQGTEGAFSAGKVDINFKRAGTIQIKNLNDITLTQFADSAGNLIAWDNVCVDTSTATTYSIVAANASGSFELVSGTNKAEYTLHYADGIGNEATKIDTAPQLQFGLPLRGLAASKDDCATDSSTIWVKLTKAQIPDNDGTYTDTVTLTVTPE